MPPQYLILSLRLNSHFQLQCPNPPKESIVCGRTSSTLLKSLYWNAPSYILFTPSGIMRVEFISPIPEKASRPIIFSLEGKTTERIVLLLLNPPEGIASSL